MNKRIVFIGAFLLLGGCTTSNTAADMQVYFDMGDLEYKGSTPQERQQEMQKAISVGKTDATTILPISVSGSWNDEAGENLPNAVYIDCWYDTKTCHEAISQVMKGVGGNPIWYNDINYMDVEVWNREKIIMSSAAGQCFKREITIDRIAQTVTSRAEFIGDPALCENFAETESRINRLGNYPPSLNTLLKR